MDIDIRPVPVDRLVTFDRGALVSRRDRLIALREEFQQRITSALTELAELETIMHLVESEYDSVVLAERLLNEDIVRVICPTCKGTGMRPSDVLSGQVRHGSAFEATGKANVAPVIDERSRCKDCQGLRWIIMDRFRG